MQLPSRRMSLGYLDAWRKNLYIGMVVAGALIAVIMIGIGLRTFFVRIMTVPMCVCLAVVIVRMRMVLVIFAGFLAVTDVQPAESVRENNGEDAAYRCCQPKHIIQSIDTLATRK